MWEQRAPEAIEEQSMEIIRRELKGIACPPECSPVVQRVIHTTADFTYAHTLYFSANALRAGREAIVRGTNIIADTNMVAAGINKGHLFRHGGRVVCHMAEKGVAIEAKNRGITRAAVAMEKAVGEDPKGIYAIGNAPTALLRLCELIAQGLARPALVVAVPVGFVNVVEAKERIMGLAVPQIVARGRKGGSPVAAAIINALLYSINSGHD